MIEISYYYEQSQGKWILCTNNFHNVNKAIRFMYVIQKNPRMVYMALHCDDPYDDKYIRRRFKI